MYPAPHETGPMRHSSRRTFLKAAAGITAGLLRVSVGIEQSADLVADVRAGLDRAAR